MTHAAPAGGALPPSDTASPLITRNDGGPPEAEPPPRTGQRHPIRFTGSGSEYFRIWIVNLLLMLVTLGLYYPWAKVRKLKYFYNNTEVAGHALDFHGEPRRMLRGFLLMAALLTLYSVAGKVSPVAGALAGIVMVAVWPALIRSSLQFRLANSSWRGLRFQFTGNLKDIYLVFALPMLGMVALAVVTGGLAGQLDKNAQGWLFGGLLLLLYALFPYAYHRLKTYQHAHYALANWQTEYRATFPNTAAVFLKTAAVSLLVLLLAVAAGAAVVAASGASLIGRGDENAPLRVMMTLVPVMLLMVLGMQIVPLPYFESRMQNLVWSQTGNRDLRFKSHLKFWPLLRQTALNWLLVVLTLGLYWPFAAVAIARLKLQAISVHLRTDPDTLVARARPAYREGAGDAAADLAGIDFGL